MPLADPPTLRGARGVSVADVGLGVPGCLIRGGSMHYVRRFVASACAVAIATACGDHTGTGVVAEPNDLMATLAAAGFDIIGAKVRGDEVVVEGDIVIAKETINSWASRTSSARRRPADLPNLQWRATTVVDSTSASAGIKVDLSGLSSADWQAAARQAILEWN